MALAYFSSISFVTLWNGQKYTKPPAHLTCMKRNLIWELSVHNTIHSIKHFVFCGNRIRYLYEI